MKTIKIVGQGVAFMRVSSAKVRQRLWIALWTGTLIFFALMLRLAYVQLWLGPELTQKAEDSWRRNIPFEEKRGEIWDRNGVRLAYNITSPTIMAIPAQVKDARNTAAQIARVLQTSEETIYVQISKKTLLS